MNTRIKITLVFWMTLIAFLPVTSTSFADEPGEDGVIEEIEEIEEVGEIDTVDAAGEVSFWGKLGRFHAPMVHFPIAWLILLFLIDSATIMFKKPWQKAGLYIGVLTLLSFLPVIATGLMRAGSMPAQGETLELIMEHRNLGIATAVITFIAVGLRLAKRDLLEGKGKYIYLALIVLATFLVAEAGHHGGEIVFGEDFLPF